MAYKITNWIGSEWKAEQAPQLQAGEYDLYISRASFDETINRYKITVEDVQTGAEGTFSWYTVTKDGSLNKISVGTLGSLGKAVFGQEIGVPFADDIVHAVVHAVVDPGKPYVNNKGETVQYPVIYHFTPTTKAVYVLVAESGREIIEQYTIQEGQQ